MANLRDLKKDIDYLVGQVVMDCFEYIYKTDGADVEDAYQIVGDVLVLRSQLRKRANHPGGRDNRKFIKNHYMQIAKDLVEGCDSCYNKLGALTNS